MPKNPNNLANAAAFTLAGCRVDLAAPKVTSILVTDLAEQLAKLAMFRGATRGLYTVAQHSAIIAGEIARAEGALAAFYALLHHAEHCYSSDPAHLPALQAAIHQAFGLSWPMPQSVAISLTRIHDCVELTELRQLCNGCAPEIARLERRGAVPLKPRILPLGWDRAHERFVEALRTYARVAGLSKRPAFGDLL
jgi:hypothetical protein